MAANDWGACGRPGGRVADERGRGPCCARPSRRRWRKRWWECGQTRTRREEGSKGRPPEPGSEPKRGSRCTPAPIVGLHTWSWAGPTTMGLYLNTDMAERMSVARVSKNYKDAPMHNACGSAIVSCMEAVPRVKTLSYSAPATGEDGPVMEGSWLPSYACAAACAMRRVTARSPAPESEPAGAPAVRRRAGS